MVQAYVFAPYMPRYVSNAGPLGRSKPPWSSIPLDHRFWDLFAFLDSSLVGLRLDASFHAARLA